MCFFFFKQKTAYEMRISDWSSDVCSSDLEQHITAGPEDFARIMAQSAAVATNFVHGCVFALLNAKPFVCASSPYRFNKVRDLAHAVGAEKHLVAEDAGDSHYASSMEEGLNPDIFSRIAALRQRSDAYLDHVLN